ncbi:MAG: hypothetical protein ABJH05_05095 [Fulvivirga sp.]
MALFSQVTQKVYILPESRIFLDGESNINTFSCELCNGSESTILSLCYQPQKLAYIFDQNQYALSIDNFVCDNKHITADLKEALKIDQHPYMYLQLKKLIGFDNKLGVKQAELSITIAGVTNDYCLNYELKPGVEKGQFQVFLNSDFDMSDFEIEPPTALMGLVKVKKDIEIKLHLVLAIKQEDL